MGGSLPSTSPSFFLVWTLILFRILLSASTSPVLDAPGPGTILSGDGCWNPILLVLLPPVVCLTTCYLGGATDKLLALKYGCSYLRSTNTRAILSSLSSCSTGVSLLCIKIIKMMISLHFIKVEMHVLVGLQNVRGGGEQVVKEVR